MANNKIFLLIFILINISFISAESINQTSEPNGGQDSIGIFNWIYNHFTSLWDKVYIWFHGSSSNSRILIESGESKMNILKYSGQEKIDYKPVKIDNNYCFKINKVNPSNDITIYTNKEKTKTKKLDKIKIDKVDYYCLDSSYDYVQLGENTIIIKNQETKSVKFDFGNSNATITLYKDIYGDGSDWNNTVNELFVYYNNDTYKFGANDSYNNNLSRYKYILNSTSIKLVKEYKYSSNGYVFDFSDICNKDFNGIYSDCQFKLNGTLEGTFYSDYLIDPTIYVYNNLDSETWNVNTKWEENNVTHLEIDNTTAPYNSLVGYWSFDADNSTTAYDLSNYNNNGIYTNGALSNSTNGIYGSYGQFDGVNDYVTLGSNLKPTSSVTLSAWIKTSDSDPDYMIIGADYYFTGLDGYGLVMNAAHKPYFAVGNNTVMKSAISPNSINDSLWHHVVGMYDGSQANIYVDGEYQNSIAMIGPISSSVYNFNIGRHPEGDSYFNGSIDEVMIFNTALNSSQILDIYNNQSKRFKSVGNETLLNQLNNNSDKNLIGLNISSYNLFNSKLNVSFGYWNISYGYDDTSSLTSTDLNYGLVNYYHLDSFTSETNITPDSSGLSNLTCNGMDGCNISNGKYNNSFIFDGENDYLVSSNNQVIGDTSFTLSAWIKPNQFDGYRSALSIGKSGVGGLSAYIGAGEGYIGGGLGWASWYRSTLNTSGVWVHVTMTFDSVTDEIIVYTNGVNSADNIFGVIDLQSNNITLGRICDDFSNVPFNGSIDEAMILNRSLSSDEVKQVFTMGRAKFGYTNTTSPNTYITIPKHSTNILPIINFTSGTNDFYTPFVLNTITLFEQEPAPTLSFVNPTSTGTQPDGQTFILANLSKSGAEPITTNITLWNSTGLANSTDQLYYNFSGLNFGNYVLNATATNVGGTSYSENINILLSPDSTNPILTINSPQNQTYSSTMINLIGSCTDLNLDSTWYSLDNGINTTFNFNTTISTTGYEIYHNITIWCNDSNDNTVMESRRFYIGSPYNYNQTCTTCQNTSNILNQDCPSGYSVTGYYSNGTAKCSLNSVGSSTCKINPYVYDNYKLPAIRPVYC